MPAMTKTRKRSRFLSFLKWTGISVAALAGLALVLNLTTGMHLQITGGLMPQLDFHHEDRHYRAIETHREQSPDIAPVASPAPPESVADEPDEAVLEAEQTEAPESGLDPATPSPGSWPYYRGVHMDGRYPQPINTAWPNEGPPELWRIPVGGGYASFVVGDGLAYTIEQRREQEVVAAYDLQTGVERWNASWDARFEESMGGDGPRATPALYEGTLVALGATGELQALDAASGASIWRTNVLKDSGAANLTWGMAASPAILDGAVLTAPGGPNGAVIAYELETGAIRWRALDAQGAYTAPTVFTLDDLSQIVLIGADQVVGLATDGSETYWSTPWATMNGINAAQPLQVAPNRIFVSSGYGHGAAVLEVDAAPEANTASVKEIWFNNRMKNTFSTSVFHDGYVYGLDNGILACVDAETGDRMWKGGRYGHGQLLLASGHLLITTERGQLVLVRATPESHQEVAALPAVSGRTWNNPAIAEGILLVRNDREAVAFDIRPQT
ncbi:MAG: PQQ-binding-like beta-propeller repeat protein [Holophagales bacterium]|nr:PQQ-binding-like beta-propeller repeat protein [Holophagales bacterium]MYF94038.1 PQQ-binding-like beta-propeller repeat protein [Holophagales bacterium]